MIRDRSYQFEVRAGRPQDREAAKRGTKVSRGANFRCLLSDAPLAPDYIKSEGRAGRMGARLMAIVAEGDRERVYLSPSVEQVEVARRARPTWRPELAQPENPRWFSPPDYGLPTFGDLFTPRQLVALTTFSDLVGEAMERVRRDAIKVGLPDDDIPLRDGGTGARAYAEAVAVYLAFAVDKGANYWSTLCAWHQTRPGIVSTFGRQALPMVWDYAEANPFSTSSGNAMVGVRQTAKMIERLGIGVPGTGSQADAATQSVGRSKVISTDPPYYDNIGYADLSDFFYLWLRRSQRLAFPDLFATLAVPKAEELVATPYRHETKQKAEEFFLNGMTEAMGRLARQSHPGFPVTLYYAFKQSERKPLTGATASTGWETFLAAVMQAGFSVTGTWPMRTEYTGNLKKNVAALASSIVLVCRRRPADAPLATRREFLTALRAELPPALHLLQSGNVAPVDLAQAAIGPGMAVYTRYGKVLDASGKPMKVREALAMINQILDESLGEQEGDYDADTRWALAWFEKCGFEEGEFGDAEMLSKAKVTAVAGLVSAGIIESSAGKVRLLRPSELPSQWDPASDTRLTTWEMVHHLIRLLESGGEEAAAGLVRRLGSVADVARDLAYRLYSSAERKKRAAAALQYNGLVGSWAEIRRLASAEPPVEQTEAF